MRSCGRAAETHLDSAGSVWGQTQGVGCGGKAVTADIDDDFEFVVLPVFQADLGSPFHTDLDGAQVECVGFDGQGLGAEGGG